MSAHLLVVTGTDTGVGKTRAACALLHRARGAGYRAVGFKPVASGCEPTAAGLRNEDALALQAAAASQLPYARINPYAFAEPIAPHLAAADAAVRIERRRLDAAVESLAADHELVVVEGAGGWQVPLGEDWTFADWVAAHRWPVLLVVGLRLGCISHALLSAESILRRSELAGWIANTLPPAMPRAGDNVESLRRRLPAPLLGVLPAGGDVAAAVRALDGEALKPLFGSR